MRKNSTVQVARSSSVQRKNFYLRTETLKKAQKALGAKTETETVERALELVVFQEDSLKAFRELCEKGEVEDVFGHYRRTGSR
jgi:hypothetical protein